MAWVITLAFGVSFHIRQESQRHLSVAFSKYLSRSYFLHLWNHRYQNNDIIIYFPEENYLPHCCNTCSLPNRLKHEIGFNFQFHFQLARPHH